MAFNSIHFSRARLLAPALLLPLLTACGGGGGGETPVAGTGTLRVALTDAPACGFNHVYVTVEGVRVHASESADERSGGWTDIPVRPARRIDLLTLTNGVLEELGSTPLPVGRYTQLRLMLSPNTGNRLANAVVPTGQTGEVALDTPSAVQSGLKVVRPFTIAANQVADLVIDFDACRSIVRRGNGSFGLKPVLMAELRNVGAVSGTIDGGPAGVTVSVQKDGEVIRSTVPVTTSGAFNVPFLDPARAPYEVVITGPDRATAVVTGVPVSTASVTPLGTISLPLATASPAARKVSGTVGPTAARETAEVRALQAVGSVPRVEVAQMNVETITGGYSLALPVVAPRLAAYSTTLPLSFAPQAASAARYTLQARATGFNAATQTIEFTTADLPDRSFTLTPVTP